MIQQPGQWQANITINGKELIQDELHHLYMTMELGNKMAWCEIGIVTKRKDIYRQCLKEMAPIEIDFASLDVNNEILERKRARYFLSNTDIDVNVNANNRMYYITIRGIADAWKYLGYTNTQSATDRENSPRFLSELIYFKEKGKKGSGSLKIDIKDSLLTKATDWMFWIQPDVTGIELVNQILLRPILKTNTNRLNENRNYIYSSLVNFDREGNPVLEIYDILLRTQGFNPPYVKLQEGRLPLKFSFYGKDKEKIVYNNVNLDIKGAEYSSMYWQRTAAIYDMEEGEFIFRRIKQPKLFPDSMDYVEPKEELSDDEYSIFTNYERWNMEWYNTNHYNMHYAIQKFQITANLLALRKINVNMNFRGKFINAKPVDICEVEIQEGTKEPNILNIDTKLSTRYMITKITYGVVNGQLFTSITASRDSFAK